MDTLSINAGPSAEEIPKGYTRVQVIPSIDPAYLMYKRILYKWEAKADRRKSNYSRLSVSSLVGRSSVGGLGRSSILPSRPSGWFIATIVGTSKEKDKNYNIKYDKAETGSLFVDGVHAVKLSLEGDTSYGRRWVVVEPINGGGGLRGSLVGMRSSVASRPQAM